MTKISNKFRKPYFWPILPISRLNFFLFKRLSSVMHNKTRASNTRLSFRKKLLTQSQENFWTEGQKGGQRAYFMGPFWSWLGIQKVNESIHTYFQNSVTRNASFVLLLFKFKCILLFCKIIFIKEAIAAFVSLFLNFLK